MTIFFQQRPIVTTQRPTSQKSVQTFLLGGITSLSIVIFVLTGCCAQSAAQDSVAIVPIGNKTVNAGETLTFAVFATNYDLYQPLHWSGSNLPPGASFTNDIFTWTPTPAQLGTHNNIHFEVNNGASTASEDITITVSTNSILRTFYVAKNGSDANLGTEEQPWLTIQKAANTVQAGDMVIVKAGTYAERVIFPAGTTGTATAKIIFKAAPSRSVAMYGFNTKSVRYLRIEGFDITYNVGGWLGGGIWVSSSHVEIVDNYLHDIPYSAITPNWAGDINNIYVAHNRIYGCTKGFNVIGANWVVENNEVERLQYPEGGDCDYSRFFGSQHIIRNNYFHGTVESEIGASHTDGFQTYSNNNSIAMHIIIEGNRVRDFYAQGFMMASNVAGSHDNIIIRNNILEDAGSWGICAAGISHVMVENNNFVNMGIHGIGFRMNQGVPTTGIVKNNIFYNGGSNYWKDTDAGSTCVLEGSHNLIYKTSSSVNAASYPNDIVNADPRFTDVSQHNFTLQPGSPAIDAGTSDWASQTDINGNTRYDDPATPNTGAGTIPYGDIGVYEYVGSAYLLWTR